jgi:threonine synthase
MGAEAITVSGTREDVAQAACKDSSGFYASHNWSVYFQEGMKTLAYELWEQIGDVPDNYVVPLGYGSLITGPAAGFNTLKASGATGKLPRLFGVQAENCCPMYDYYYSRAAGKEYGKTIAEGIASLNPIKKDEIALAISQSGGSIALAGDGECVSAMKMCAGKGIFIEPTSAVAVAGFIKLCADGTIKKGEKTVIILTGSGLKDIKAHG